MAASRKNSPPRKPVSRRDFLAVGGLGMVGLSMAEQAAVLRARERSGRRSVILLLMTGGPSQLETFDPKPGAPSEIRGPLRAISTAVPGLHFSEAFPRLAERADRLTVLRSLFHDAAPIHEAGLQLLQTGRLARGGRRPPSLGAVVARLLGPRDGLPPHVILGGRLAQTGVEAYRGDGAGLLGDDFQPLYVDDAGIPLWPRSEEPTAEPLIDPFDKQRGVVRESYGETAIGRRCWQAARLVEQGVRVVTVNMFDRLHGRATWDAHADPASPATLFDYRDTIGPQFDRACAALLDDLHSRGLWQETLVVATGEFGRNPRRNALGGRDHWSRVWSALLAGGGATGGRVIGESDRYAEAPVDHPISLPRLVATMYQGLRIDPQALLTVGDVEQPILGVSASPELLA